MPAATPVAESAIFTGLVPLSFVRAKLPFTAPADVGLNTTLKVTLCPAASAKGTFKPVVLKPVPVTPACVMLMVDPLVFVSKSDWLWLVPTCTFPKVMATGAAFNPPTGLV